MNGTFEKCRINKEISNIRYYQFNSKSAGQNNDKFDTWLKGKTQQVTLIIPFIKLNVIVETKTERNFLMAKKL